MDHDDYIRHEWDIGSWLSKNVARSQLPTIFYAAKTTFNNGRPCILMEKGETNVFQFLHSGERAAGQPNLISRIGDIAPRLVSSCLTIFMLTINSLISDMSVGEVPRFRLRAS